MTTPPAALTYALGDCELGPILLARSGRGLCALLIDDDPAALEAELGARFPTSTLQRDDAALAPTLAAAAQHIADPHAAPAEVLSELAPEGTEFQQLVWAALRRIKPGRTTTYAGLASVMIALVFLYFIAAIFVYGGELNASIVKAREQNAALPQEAPSQARAG